MIQLSKTKIIATIGPSSWDENVLREMISNGMSVARINASFADFDELKRVSESIKKITARVALMLDTQGHKIRVVGFDKEREIKEKYMVIVVSENFLKNREIPQNYIPISYPSLHKDITRDAQVVLDDGNIILQVKDIKGEEVFCTVIQGGILKPKKTVNVPGIHLNFPSISQKDADDIRFAVDNNFDFISASFIRNIDDVAQIRKIMGNTQTKLNAKIEDREGVGNFDQILNFVDGVMIARGYWSKLLYVSTRYSKTDDIKSDVPQACYSSTQMLESMKRIFSYKSRSNDSQMLHGWKLCSIASAETSTEISCKSVKMANE
jgi:pyruvate kinase